MTLCDVIKQEGSNILGDSISADEKFPLLLKILDAQDKLSVQVHPEDDYAMKNENGEKGKTEMWYVLDCKQGAQLVYGFKDGVTKEKFAEAIKNGNPEDILNFVDVEKGDVFFIPAGTVHAIGKGIIIAEIQQNSDTTYRVYDYNRVGADGKLRDLHIEKALDVSDISCSAGSEKTIGNSIYEGKNIRTYYIECKYFNFEKIDIVERSIEYNNNRMEILIFAEGQGEIEGESFKAGDSFVIPASLGQYEIKGKCTVLKSFVA
jgi:mannose-6-phosphate isomerase